jgi:hypothetical protein
MVTFGVGTASETQATDDTGNLPDVAAPQIGDAPNAAELQDLERIAKQKGMSLQEAIVRYAWNDNFSVAIQKIREASPEAFAGAEIVDAGHAWVAFADDAPQASRDWIDGFSSSHSGVSVEVRTGLGFTELELQKAVPAAHYAVFEAPEVRDALTRFDYATGQITTIVVLDGAFSSTVINDLQAAGSNGLVDATRADILGSITNSVVRSYSESLGENDSSSYHHGGEIITVCTSGFGVEDDSTSEEGISTAGHCRNSQTDDSDTLDLEEEYESTYGDFQWHTGPDTNTDDFYAGITSTEVNLRDVSSVGAPTVNMATCRNGAVTYNYCDDVRTLNVCSGSRCNLVEMDNDFGEGGDSGGPIYYGNTAYGLHQGNVASCPTWPWEHCDVFSRADKIDDAMGVSVRTN